MAAALVWANTAMAQDTPPGTVAAPERANSNTSADSDIVVSASRVERPGYQAPTPVTVLGPAEINIGDRPTIAQLLNDQPAFRGSVSPTTTPANTNAGTAIVDLRGLGTARTLTLIDGRRFIGSRDLNSVPVGIIKRVEVVTGGASAGWGSGAVAGVVNILIDDDLRGLTLSASGGISSRGDIARYNATATYGTGFDDDRGSIILAAGWFKDEGSFGRNDGSRPNLDTGVFTSATGQISLQNNINLLTSTPGGLIRTGPLANQQFNSDGSVSPVIFGSPSNATQTIGGTTRNVTDYYAVAVPYERYNVFGRMTYEFSPAARVWADVNFNRVEAAYPFFPENVALTIRSDNAYLTPAVRAQLGGAASITVGRLLDDIGPRKSFAFALQRDSLDIGIGIGGEMGGGWSYSAYYNRGRYTVNERPSNQRIVANFNNAVDAVISPTTGQPVCRIALTDPGTACRPLNLLGSNNASAAAIAYAFGDASQTLVSELDAVGITFRGDIFATWAGPISVAFGAEGRREGVVTTFIDAISPTRAFSLDNRFPLNGRFSVAEAFGEAVVPILNVPGSAVIELNGAVRYSDYSTSGGIWQWKVGGTAQIADDFRLRAVYSRDVRAPSIGELFSTQSINIVNVTDRFRNNATTLVTRFTGGNPNLRPEVSNTFSFGGSIAPRGIPGLSLSIDYYDIDIRGAIGTISPQDAIDRCFAGYAPACATIVRDGAGVITTLFGTQVNLAAYRTSGIDFDLGYRVPLADLGLGSNGAMRLRLLATRVNRLTINDGVNTYTRLGDVGDNAGFTTPQWKATGIIGFDVEPVVFDTRIRYVGGGTFNSRQALTNNNVSSRTYVDFNVQVNVDNFTLFGSVVNAFDRDPPFVTYATAIYDTIGRYFTVGARVKF